MPPDMFSRLSRIATFALAVPLAGCLDVPHPFSDPGAEARKLALSPPPARLDVPVPPESLLDNARAGTWAQAMTRALLDQGVPAVAQPVRPGDWWLKMSAVSTGGQIVPRYAVMTPQGKLRGTQDGDPIAAQAWSEGTTTVLDGSARQAAPALVSMLTGIQADMMNHDPHSLMHRPAKIYFKGVSGAPGDGNHSLANAFVNSIRDPQDILQNSAKSADYTVYTTVRMSPAPQGANANPQQHIEIVWHVADPHGTEAGAATQLHDVDAHSLDGAWGETADAAAQEAAAGVRQIITNYSGRANAPLPPSGAPRPAAPSAG